MMDDLSGLAGGGLVFSRHRLLGWTLGFLLLPLLSGCGGKEERPAPDAPPAAAVSSEATPAFNRDMHVIQELWKELQALEQATDPSAEKKRQTLRQALQERVDALDASADSLDESERQLLADIKRGISQAKP